MKKKTNKYYKKFIYRVEKKLTVENYFKIKDYAKQQIYIYIIHDNIDNNRFIFISSKHYEENTKLSPDTFRFQQVKDLKDDINLKSKTSKFGIKFFKLLNENGEYIVNLRELVYSNSGKSTKKLYKVHIRKITLDNPDWYLEFLLDKKCNSHKKKMLQLLLYNNKYNPEIIYNTISSFFILENPDYQKFNDHSILLDEGKTGKSSIVGYMGEKVDNVSIAGLYGSSDGKNAKFRGGLVTTTKKPILIDEINELIKNQKGEKILSVLNSALENGTYNYQKQFSQKIRINNQFFFMGNISDELNFPLILEGTFGNVETLGRRIGIITYNIQLKGFQKGNIRPETPNPYLNAISIYMSNIFNYVLINTKYIKKLYRHKEYIEFEKHYKKEIILMLRDVEDIVTKSFLKSHSGAFDRVITRGLKMWIFNNIDKFIKKGFVYDNHLIYEVLQESKKHISSNLINLKNIVEHVKDFSMTDKTQEINKNSFQELQETYKKLLKFFWLNQNSITQKGVEIGRTNLKEKTSLKFVLQNYRRRGIPKKHKSFLLGHGLNITVINDKIIFRIINIKTFEGKIEGVFDLSDDKSINLKKVATKWNKDNISELDLGEDLT